MVQYNHNQGRELAQSEIKVGEFKSSWSKESTNKNLKTLTNLKEKEIKTMATNELLNKIEALNEWEQLMEEARQEAEALRDSIKQEMLNRMDV